MRRYLACCPEEEPWIFRMLDLISREVRVMDLFIFFLSLLLSWICLGWRRERLGSGLPPSPSYDDWACAAFLLFYFGGLAFCVFAMLLREGFLGGDFADFQGSLQLLPVPLGERDKML